MMSMKAINVCWGNYVLIDYTWCKYRFFFFFFSKVSIPRPKYLLLVGDTRAFFFVWNMSIYFETTCFNNTNA